jgi:membrane-associated PAP2 superfamily phosphatase
MEIAQNKTIKTHFFVLILFFAVFVLLFFTSSLDKIVSSYFYDSPSSAWFLTESFWVNFFYTYGPLPQLLTLNILWAFLLLRYLKDAPSINTNTSFLIVGSIFVSEILVFLLKEIFNRPRPREILFFGGDYSFVEFWRFGMEGLSFPSSHAKSGFIMAVFFYLFLSEKKKIAYLVLWVSLLWGAAISFARIASGGHFLSDVIFSLFLSHFTILAVVFFLKNKHFSLTSFLSKTLFAIYSILLMLVNISLFYRFFYIL